MIAAAGYVLKVPVDRRNVLLDYLSYYGPSIAEPVPRFEHSRAAPLVVFASFEDREITHIADGKKGASAGTDLVRLNMADLERLARPITFGEIVDAVSRKLRSHLNRVLLNGGLLPPQTLAAFVDCIVELDGSLAARLARYSGRRRDALGRLRPRAKENLAFQKETLGIALDIGGIPRDELLAWRPLDDTQRSFLDGLPGAQVREDAMLLADFSVVPGFDAIGEATHVGYKVFERPAALGRPSVRMTVIMANRLPLEQQTGTDLIYFNEAYHSFVMVQYKAMEKRNEQSEFRWREGDQFTQEVERMSALTVELSRIQSGDHPDGFRFSDNPFFLKFCPRVVFNPDDKGLFKGIYMPLQLWKLADAAGQLQGRNGGKLLTFENVGRRINNSEFVGLVENSWIGTSIEQSAVLIPLIREILTLGKTVTFAVKHGVARRGLVDLAEEELEQ